MTVETPRHLASDDDSADPNRHLRDTPAHVILNEASRRLDPNRNHRCPPLTEIYDVSDELLAAALRRMRSE